MDLVDVYIAQVDRLATDSTAEGMSDSAGENGNAVNNQSMLLVVSNGTKKALLKGDMQFMRPQFNSGEVKSEMATLRQ